MVTKTIDISTTSLTLEKLLEQLEPDTEILLTRGGAPLARVEAVQEPPQQQERILGLHRGEIWMSDDFDDELPDEFWLGDD